MQKSCQFWRLKIIDKQNLKNLQLDEIMDYFEDNISNNDFFSY